MTNGETRQAVGASASPSGSRPSGRAAAHPVASRFDPSRWPERPVEEIMADMDTVLPLSILRDEQGRRSFAETSAILARMFSVPSERLGAFWARLKQFQKLGCPAGSNVGRGKRYAYSRDDTWKLIVLLEMCRVGVSPEKAAEAVDSLWGLIVSARDQGLRVTLKTGGWTSYLSAPGGACSGVVLDMPALLRAEAEADPARASEAERA